MALKSIKVLPGLAIRLRESSRILSPEIERRVAEIWEAETAARGGRLFDGGVLSVENYGPGFLDVTLGKYRESLAQIRDPSLYSALRVRPLAISGLVFSGSKVGFGKRAGHVTEDPGLWELVPSGGVTPDAVSADGGVSFEAQFLQEWEEELGHSRSVITSILPFLIVEDPLRHVVDIGLRAMARLDGQVGGKRSDEYDEVVWVESAEVEQFCSERGKMDGIVAVSLELLRAQALLAR